MDCSESISAPHSTELDATELNGVLPVVQFFVASSNVPFTTVASVMLSSERPGFFIASAAASAAVAQSFCTSATRALSRLVA